MVPYYELPFMPSWEPPIRVLGRLSVKLGTAWDALGRLCDGFGTGTYHPSDTGCGDPVAVAGSIT
jgi:hypothetical protein